MKKVKAKAKLIQDPRRGWALVLLDPIAVKSEAVDKFVTASYDGQMILLDATFNRPQVEKSRSQLAYMHVAIWPAFYKYWEEQGDPVEDEETKQRIRDIVKHAVGFVEVADNILTPTGRDPIQRIRSFASATMEETSQIIDRILRLATEYGIYIQSPEDYLKEREWEAFAS